ncbi:MAG: hypothetical protein P1U68_14395 [Verrucomicrobiales bacterium]|nr:hypothetical protein [Verrucomicrobiales bacterium]
MKKLISPLSLLLAASAFTLTSIGCAEEDHDHAEHKHAEHEEGDHDEHHDHDGIEAGPNGGRLLTSVEPHLEFFVTEDRKVRISAVNDDEKLQPIAGQKVSLIGGDRSNPTRMKFTKEGDTLISDIAFPEGNDFPVVIMITPTPESDKVTEKFNLNLADCPSCENKEYACTCDHAH